MLLLEDTTFLFHIQKKEKQNNSFIDITLRKMAKKKNNIWQDKTFRVYIWQVLATLISVAGIFAVDLPAEYQYPLVVLVVPLVNLTLKYINVAYFGDLGVKDIEFKIDKEKNKEIKEALKKKKE